MIQYIPWVVLGSLIANSIGIWASGFYLPATFTMVMAIMQIVYIFKKKLNQ